MQVARVERLGSLRWSRNHHGGGSSEDDEVARLRRQNGQLKDLVAKALRGKITWAMVPEELSEELRGGRGSDAGTSLARGKLLRELTAEDDRDVVLAALRARKGSSGWHNLPPNWKEDAVVACAAFEQDYQYGEEIPLDAGAISMHVYCVDDDMDGGEKRNSLRFEHLPYHLCMNKNVILTALRTKWGPGLGSIHHKFRTDPDVVEVAFLHGKLDWDSVPVEARLGVRKIAHYGVYNDLIQADECADLFNAQFWENALLDGKLKKWRQLPATFRGDRDLALRLFAKNSELCREILEHFPSIRSIPSHWFKLVHSPVWDDNEFGHERCVKELLKDFSPSEFFSSQDIMLEICSGCTAAFELVDGALLDDQDFLASMVGKNADVVKFLSHETQLRHRSLIMQAIPHLGRCGKTSMYNCMAAHYAAEAMHPSFWKSRQFALHWIASGHGFPSQALGRMLTAWINDREICLAAAVRGNTYYTGKWHGDIEFMLEVLENYPNEYDNARDEAARDPWVMTVVFAALPDRAADEMKKLHFDGHDDVIKEYISFLDANLNPYRVFSECVLANMLSTQSVHTTGTPLTLLNQGPETSTRYKRNLAEYLGIPKGKRLRQLQQADRNTRKVIAQFSELRI